MNDPIFKDSGLWGRTRLIVVALGLCVGISAAFIWNAFQAETREVSFPDSTPLLVDRFDPAVAQSSWGPRDVVVNQLAALKASALTPDEMIVCYSLASPQNRLETGPYDNFNRLVRTEPYLPLVGHLTCLVGRAAIEEDQASVTATVVDLTGLSHAYQFLLSRQKKPFIEPQPVEGTEFAENSDDRPNNPQRIPAKSSPRFEECWLTDAVIPIPQASFLPQIIEEK